MKPLLCFASSKNHVFWKKAINVLRNSSSYILKGVTLLKLISVNETYKDF